MIKVYIALGVIVFTFGAGWKAKGWVEDSKKVKILTESIGTDNNNKAKLSKFRTTTTGVTSSAKRSIAKIQLDSLDTGCSISGFNKLHNETYNSFPSMLFQQLVIVPITD